MEIRPSPAKKRRVSSERRFVASPGNSIFLAQRFLTMFALVKPQISCNIVWTLKKIIAQG